MSKLEKFVSKLFQAGALVILLVLAAAGMLHLIAAVDPVIAYPLTVVVLAFLAREFV